MEKKSLSFDDHCNRLKNSNKVWKKMMEVINLGYKVEKFVYPVEHRNVYSMEQIWKKPGSLTLALSNTLSKDLIISCNSITHSDIRNFNNRI